MTLPTHVVMDSRDGYIFGAFNGNEAREFAAQRNAGMEPEFRTYKVMRLVDESTHALLCPGCQHEVDDHGPGGCLRAEHPTVRTADKVHCPCTIPEYLITPEGE